MIEANKTKNTTQSVAGDEDTDEEEVNSTYAQNAIRRLQPIISHLRENSHLQLALRFLTMTTAAVRQTLVQHDMGFPVSSEVKTFFCMENKLHGQRLASIHSTMPVLRNYCELISSVSEPLC